LLVVLGHAIQYNMGDNHNNNPLFRFIYAFHMPLFMFISGFLSFGTFDGSTAKLWKRFQALIIPFFTWFFIGYIFTFLINRFTGNAQGPLFSEFMALLQAPDRGLWFLWILFLNFIALFFSLQLKTRYTEFFLFAQVLLLLILNSFLKTRLGALDLWPWFLFFFALGYSWHKHQDQLERLIRMAGLVSLVLFPILVSFWYKNAEPSFVMSLQLSGKLKTLILFVYAWSLPVFGILFCYTIFKKLMTLAFPFKSQLLVLSTMTLELYCIHFYFLNFCGLMRSWPLALSISTSFLLALAGSIAVQWLLHKSPILAALCFGKERATKKVSTSPN
ncbi:MAG: acyltransferase family protein, partial [Bacteroidia bacterium]